MHVSDEEIRRQHGSARLIKKGRTGGGSRDNSEGTVYHEGDLPNLSYIYRIITQ